MNRKKSKSILIIGIISIIGFIIITVTVGVYFLYKKYQNNPKISEIFNKLITSSTTITNSNSSTLTTNTTTSTSTTTSSSSTTTTTLDPTNNWNTYSIDSYSFKYPDESTLTSNQPSQNCEVFEETKVTYSGPNQPQLPTELIDGYILTVLKECETPGLSSQVWTENNITETQNNFIDEDLEYSEVTQTEISGIEAYKYSTIRNYPSITSKSTTTTLINNGNMYHIILSVVGESSDIEEYESITEQMLATFIFSEN